MDREVSDRGWNDRVLSDDIDALARNWWAVVLRGVAGIIFGILVHAYNPELVIHCGDIGSAAIVRPRSAVWCSSSPPPSYDRR